MSTRRKVRIIDETKMGQIGVGRIAYNQGKKVYPSYKNFTLIEVMTSSTAYGSLSPYNTTVTINGNKVLIENLWQFSKVYEQTPEVCQTYSRYDKTITLQRASETHFKDGQMTDDWFKWRQDGFNNKYAVRYPVGFSHRHKVLFSICPQDNKTRYSYIEARKRSILNITCKA